MVFEETKSHSESEYVVCESKHNEQHEDSGTVPAFPRQRLNDTVVVRRKLPICRSLPLVAL